MRTATVLLHRPVDTFYGEGWNAVSMNFMRVPSVLFPVREEWKVVIMIFMPIAGVLPRPVNIVNGGVSMNFMR